LDERLCAANFADDDDDDDDDDLPGTGLGSIFFGGVRVPCGWSLLDIGCDIGVDAVM
jgi:hypothetical protein